MVVKTSLSWDAYLIDDKYLYDHKAGEINNNFDINNPGKYGRFVELELPKGVMVEVFSHDGMWDTWPGDYLAKAYLCNMWGNVGLYETGDVYRFTPELIAEFSRSYGGWTHEYDED